MRNIGTEVGPPVPRSTFHVPRWSGGAVRVGVDVGGTFTDLVAVAADGAIAVHKVATTPEDPAVGMFRAIEPMSAPVELLVHGTTIATNALLERRGARVVLVTTRGFEDLLWLRRQDRAALYDLARDHPPPLVARGDVLGVAGRMGPTGVLQSLADAEVERVVAEVQALAPQSVAVAFRFAFRHPEHERRIAAALRGALGESVPVAASHEVLPVFREFERVSTTTAEAYLRPKVATYLAGLDRDARSRGVAALRIMTSAGGTLAPAAAACRTAASPLADEVRLDPRAAALAVAALGDTAGRDATTIAAGIVAVATAVMARALRRVSVARGLDPRRMALVPFGGAGPLFACALADALGIRRIVIPPHPGVLSALGLAAAAERVDLLTSYHRELDRLQPDDLEGAFSPLLREGSKQLPEGALWRYADCRFAGQGYEVTVPVTTNHPRQIRDTFLAAHHARFGHSGGGSVELVTLRVVAVREAPLPRFTGTRRRNGAACGSRAVTLRGAPATASLWALDELAAGVTLEGPAVLAGRDATGLIEPGWRGTVQDSGAVLVERL